MRSCGPAESAEAEIVRVTGLAITPPGVDEDRVFERLVTPAARLARLSPVSNVIETWRGRAMLDPKFQATVLGWPVDVTLIPGKVLDKVVGFEPWRGEQATEGLLGREAYFIEAVVGILTEVNGFVMALPGGQRTLIVAEEYFSEVQIGDPIAFSELGIAEEREVRDPAGDPQTEQAGGEDEDEAAE
jgi:hypothetical protein